MSIAVTVDIAAFAVVDGSLAVLLVERRHPPFQGMDALPGGFVDPGESLTDAARRELAEETGVNADRLHQYRAYGDPGRDPRGHTVSIAFWTVVADPESVEAGDDAAAAHLIPVVEALASDLAFDHDVLLWDALVALAEALGNDQKRHAYGAEITVLGGLPIVIRAVGAARQPSS